MTVLDALQATLADEHAALYTYGVLGARTSQAATPTLYDALTAGYRRHRSRRDQLRLMVVDAGGEPAPAAAAYELAGVLLREVREGCVGASSGDLARVLASVAASTAQHAAALAPGATRRVDA